jgi:hypothetical protein
MLAIFGRISCLHIDRDDRWHWWWCWMALKSIKQWIRGSVVWQQLFVWRVADGCCLSRPSWMCRIYVQRTDSRLEYSAKIRRWGSLDRTSLGLIYLEPTLSLAHSLSYDELWYNKLYDRGIDFLNSQTDNGNQPLSLLCSGY